MHLPICVLMSVLLMSAAERLLVSGSSRSISASVGEDVTLNCSVDSRIKPEDIEEVSWRKTDEDEDIPVLLYQNNEAFPDSSDQQYRDRVEFFTDEIPKGNFSLRLKSVRTEDKGVYMCEVFARGLSANTTVVLERLGFSFSHIMVLMLCIAASVSALLPCIIIYCRSQNTDSTATKRVRTLGFLHVFLPNIMMFVAFVLWGVTEGFLYETIFCSAFYILRPLMVINVAPYLEEIPDRSLLSEFAIFMVVYFSVFTKNMEMTCCGDICKWIWDKVTDVAYFSFLILPSLQFNLLFFAFGAARGGFLLSIIFSLLFFVSFSCLRGMNKEKSCSNLLNKTSWMIFMLIMTAVMVYFYITSLKNEKVSAGWTCAAVFLQVLWVIAIYIQKEDLDLTLTFKHMLYVFGSVAVVLVNSVTLMTELILKTVNGERAVGDLRVVVFSSESIFAFSLLILSIFGPWISDIKCWQSCQKAARTDDIPVTGLNQDSQNAAENDASASGSNQIEAELSRIT